MRLWRRCVHMIWKRPSAEGISEKWCLGTLFLPRYCHEVVTEKKWLSIVKLWWGAADLLVVWLSRIGRRNIIIYRFPQRIIFSAGVESDNMSFKEALTSNKAAYGQSYMSSWRGVIIVVLSDWSLENNFPSWPQHHHFSFFHLFSHPHLQFPPPHTTVRNQSLLHPPSSTQRTRQIKGVGPRSFLVQ